MAIINVLDKKVYNRISAGEVVERPASVIKELVENSIDAGATKIDVQITGGGIASMQVTDNGCGIEREQLERAFLPHATSKISKAEDLDDIVTLGFRGEALASIGAVSRATIISKPQEQDMGMAIDCNGGELSEVYENPAIAGTTVICKDLFFNTPVRAKFLKSAKTEENEVIATLLRVALSRPNVAFTLVCDGKTAIETFGGGLKECISCVYGAKTLEQCYMIESEKNGIKVSGFIGKISFTKPTRAYQTLIVNGRYVVDSTVGSAIANAYGGYLMKRQYPFYVLNLDIPTQAVDVNVHPRKAEVRFSNNQIIYAAVYSTVTKVLDGSSAALEIIKEDGSQFSYKEEGRGEIIQPITYQTGENNSTTSSADIFAEKSDKKQAIKQLSDKNTFGYDYAKRGSGYASSSSTLTFNDSGYLGEMQQDKEQGIDVFAENKKYIEKLEREKQLKELAYKQQEIEVEVPMVYVGQLFNTYLIFQMGSEMFLIDQHAAHERLIYDELCEKAQNSDLGSLPLLLPYTFNVAREDFNCIYTRMDQFRSMGFDITNVGDSSFKISAIPCDLSEINLKEFFDDILYDDSFKKETITLTLREKLMQKACKHAVKAGDKLTSKDIDSLMAKLKGNFGLRCPHGRPVAVKVTKQEIEKWFKRIV